MKIHINKNNKTKIVLDPTEERVFSVFIIELILSLPTDTKEYDMARRIFFSKILSGHQLDSDIFIALGEGLGSVGIKYPQQLMTTSGHIETGYPTPLDTRMIWYEGWVDSPMADMIEYYVPFPGKEKEEEEQRMYEQARNMRIAKEVAKLKSEFREITTELPSEKELWIMARDYIV